MRADGFFFVGSDFGGAFDLYFVPRCRSKIAVSKVHPDEQSDGSTFSSFVSSFTLLPSLSPLSLLLLCDFFLLLHLLNLIRLSSLHILRLRIRPIKFPIRFWFFRRFWFRLVVFCFASLESALVAAAAAAVLVLEVDVIV